MALWLHNYVTCELFCGSGFRLRGCGHISSCMGAKESGGEVGETELLLTGRLIRPPNDPSSILQEIHVQSPTVQVLSVCLSVCLT